MHIRWHQITSVIGSKPAIANFLMEDIADIVAFYLKGDDRNRVFYYREYAEDLETGEVNPKGIFQNFVISRVLAVHCNATTLKNSLGPTGFDACISSTRPTGALVLSIQAIKRALNYWKTGELVIPPAPLGNFSKSNWGDHVEFSEGVKKTVPMEQDHCRCQRSCRNSG
ncbi:hypothetical protein B0H10DRAFT_238512 [Mycena sp. CBHHK59/15]|nr:hypothetical protein B0H10DRAFT_238512 [Mycena sp. CBHHK59/15]